MSAEALSRVPAGMSAGETAITERVRQLQALIEQTSQIASSGVLPTAAPSSPLPTSSTSAAATSGAPANFSAALQAATTAAGQSTAAYPTSGTGESSEYEAMISQAAQRYGLDPALLHGLIQQESGFDPSSQSSAGASGLTQLMPGTAASMGVANPLNPAESIEGGARYLSGLMSQFGGNTTEALAAYNAGPGAVQQYGGVPPYPETQSYVSKVLGYAETYRQAHPGSVGLPA